jgi:hypothetical protein
MKVIKTFKKWPNICVFFVSMIFIQSISAAPATQWEKTFGGSKGDMGYSVQQTSDGGYIVAGYTFSSGAGSYDIWLIKTDADGNDIWNKTFGGSESDRGCSVQQTSDGGYIVAGVTASYGAGSYDIWLIKTDADGNDIWDKTFGGSETEHNIPYHNHVQQTSDGGYIVAGSTKSYGAGEFDAWLIKTDADGNDVWDKTFGGSDDDYAYSVQQTLDGGYIIAGTTKSYGFGGWFDAWLIKTDADGNDIWYKTFGASDTDYAYSVQQTPDSGYIIAGGTKSYGEGDYNLWLIRTNADGNDIWDKTFNAGDYNYGYSVQQTSDGGYIVTGKTSPHHSAGDYDVWLIKTDVYGNDIWDKTFDIGDLDCGYSVQQTSDGGYIVAGYTGFYEGVDDDFYLIKVSPDCIDQPSSDLTGDCKVDFRDFAVMAFEWLDCRQVDPNDCF